MSDIRRLSWLLWEARDTMKYFSLLRFIPEIPMNPAEFLLDLATGRVNNTSVP